MILNWILFPGLDLKFFPKSFLAFTARAQIGPQATPFARFLCGYSPHVRLFGRISHAGCNSTGRVPASTRGVRGCFRRAARRAYNVPETGNRVKPGQKLGDAYVAANLPVARRRLYQASVRLAMPFNEAFPELATLKFTEPFPIDVSLRPSRPEPPNALHDGDAVCCLDVEKEPGDAGRSIFDQLSRGELPEDYVYDGPRRLDEKGARRGTGRLS